MNRQLLFKANMMGASAMRRNRAAKANEDRNLKRKQLFSRGRDINISPPGEDTRFKKAAEEMALKKEMYRTRYQVYLEEKRKRLVQDEKSKKPPFVSTVRLAPKPFEFPAPLPVKNKSNHTRSVSKTINAEMLTVQTRATRSTKRSQLQQNATETKGTNKRPKIKILPTEANKEDTGLSVELDVATPLIKDEAFFNKAGPLFTSTARKFTPEKNLVKVNIPISPLAGITPLSTSICENGDAQKTEEVPAPCPIPEQQQHIEKSIEVQGKRDTFEHFRNILDDERKRLVELCTTWDTYVEENAEMYGEHCTDMINVAVGQTKLLISGKMQQYEKLIESCESGGTRLKTTGNQLPATNNVEPEDLEAYWNIVKLQISNIDSRFDKLTTLRNNNWEDHDEKPKQRKPLRKLMKAKKIKQKLTATDEVRNFLQKARRQYLENKIAGNNQSRRSQNKYGGISTPMKSNNATPTTASRNVKTPLRRSSAKKENFLPNIQTPVQRRMLMLKNASSSGKQNMRRLSETPKTTRRSVLISKHV